MKIGLDARSAIWYRGTGIGTYMYQLVKSLFAVSTWLPEAEIKNLLCVASKAIWSAPKNNRILNPCGLEKNRIIMETLLKLFKVY